MLGPPPNMMVLEVCTWPSGMAVTWACWRNFSRALSLREPIQALKSDAGVSEEAQTRP